MMGGTYLINPWNLFLHSKNHHRQNWVTNFLGYKREVKKKPRVLLLHGRPVILGLCRRTSTSKGMGNRWVPGDNSNPLHLTPPGMCTDGHCKPGHHKVQGQGMKADPKGCSGIDGREIAGKQDGISKKSKSKA